MTSVKKRETPRQARRFRSIVARCEADTAALSATSLFMNIGNLSSSSAFVATTGTSATTAAPIASDGDGANTGSSAGAVHEAHRHGGGHVGRAVMDALQALGLSVPQPEAANGNGDAQSAAGDAQASSATAASGDVRGDLHALMHQLFEAVKEQQDAAGGTANGAADPSHAGSSFSSGLASLISQVSSGTAPAGLQAAFTKLENDVHATGASTAGASTAGSTAGDATAPTLQAFLAKLQDGLGYGRSAFTTAPGAIVSCGA
jgi:hypothetical protein